MAKKNIQMIHTYTFDENGKQNTERSSFLTIENAIKNAYFWINKEESWINTTTVEITIINKETNEVLWTYKAENNASKLGKMIGKALNIRRQ